MKLQTNLTADEIVSLLGLEPHPEGGYFVETLRDAAVRRPCPFDGHLLSVESYQRSHWHRVDAVEIWHWHAGGPLSLSISADGKAQEMRLLGPDLCRLANGRNW